MRDWQGWEAYLDDFHRERAGLLEDVLSRALSGRHTPHRWLARAVSSRAELVLDLACGSGAMSRELDRPGRTVVGLDISAGELALAQERGPGPWVRGDALRLPFASGSMDAVVSSMGMAVIHPTNTLLSETARVLRPGGMLAFMAPAVRPLSPADIRTGAMVAHHLRALPQFPGPLEVTGFRAILAGHGLQKVEDQRERYRYTIRSRADAELIISALYLPTTLPKRKASAIGWLEAGVRRRGEVSLALPMRRVVAIK